MSLRASFFDAQFSESKCAHEHCVVAIAKRYSATDVPQRRLPTSGAAQVLCIDALSGDRRAAIEGQAGILQRVGRRTFVSAFVEFVRCRKRASGLDTPAHTGISNATLTCVIPHAMLWVASSDAEAKRG